MNSTDFDFADIFGIGAVLLGLVTLVIVFTGKNPDNNDITSADKAAYEQEQKQIY